MAVNRQQISTQVNPNADPSAHVPQLTDKLSQITRFGFRFK